MDCYYHGAFRKCMFCAPRKLTSIKKCASLRYCLRYNALHLFTLTCLSVLVLGRQRQDPHFAAGYYWGYQAHLDEYFANPLQCSGCLIHAQISKEVLQIGLDRFSNDSNMKSHLTALGLTEIKLVRGKWGIFPFRELRAKDPKGRIHYRLFVGLNTEDGQTLDFYFIYPSYLMEPTQNQKKVWKDFVLKTRFLDLPHLLAAQEKIDLFTYNKKGNKAVNGVNLTIEKRRSDQRVVVQVHSDIYQTQDLVITAIREVNFFTDPTCYFPRFEVDCILQKKQDQIVYETFSIKCSVVDQFSFSLPMFSMHPDEAIDATLFFLSNSPVRKTSRYEK